VKQVQCQETCSPSTGNISSIRIFHLLYDSSICTGFTKVCVEPSVLLQSSPLTAPKVSDVFHTGSPESPLWEFKHGNGNFKRGDLVGLREIKRRASRHALVHRDSYSAPKAPISQPGTPAEPIHGMQESTESRLTNLEHTLYDMHARLQRSEDNSQFLHVRNQVVMEALSRSLQLNHEMARVLLSLVPNQDSPLHRDGKYMAVHYFQPY
jgi:hypothetical protein